ncbi:MAG: hypothetical protein DRI28_05470 [Caldiserica bacterium]|nr:MAG: hypothetical protein DRI28_05470 [Caldisericota bacterium]
MRRKIPWDEIKKKYVVGIEKDGRRIYPTYEELAKEYNISFDYLRRKGSKEGWREQREIISNKIVTRESQKVIEEISDKGVEFDLKCFQIAKEAVEKIESFLKESNKKEINSLLSALQKAQEIGKNALGEEVEKTPTARTLRDLVEQIEKMNE